MGGAVRDFLLGRPNTDYDICTDALPEEIQSVFQSYPTLETGKRYGTITVLVNRNPIEITTFRSDGTYKDSRHPDAVTFGRSLTDDLSRRDFTINAIAYHPSEGFIDPYSGQKDIEDRRIRTVGEPDQRFREDALRILRALRFSATLEFEIDPATSKSMLQNRDQILHLSGERIQHEFSRFLISKNAAESFFLYREIFFTVLPELRSYDGFNPAKLPDDLFTHVMKELHHSPKDLLVRLAVLFSDLSKPTAITVERDDYAAASAEVSADILSRLRYPNAMIRDLTKLIRFRPFRYHATRESAAKALSMIGETLIYPYIDLKRADLLARGIGEQYSIYQTLSLFSLEVETILKSGGCYKLSQLAVSGDDLLQRGLAGTEIGNALQFLLDQVISGQSENRKDLLLSLLDLPK